jgi:DNA primase
MLFDKQEIIDLLKKEGKNEHVQKALNELPDKIDHEQHAQMLQEKFGIDPGKLALKAVEKELGMTAPKSAPAGQSTAAKGGPGGG